MPAKIPLTPRYLVRVTRDVHRTLTLADLDLTEDDLDNDFCEVEFDDDIPSQTVPEFLSASRRQFKRHGRLVDRKPVTALEALLAADDPADVPAETLQYCPIKDAALMAMVDPARCPPVPVRELTLQLLPIAPGASVDHHPMGLIMRTLTQLDGGETSRLYRWFERNGGWHDVPDLSARESVLYSFFILSLEEIRTETVQEPRKGTLTTVMVLSLIHI